MTRRPFKIAVTVSFVLCLAIHILWLRSYACTESVAWANRSGWRSVRTAAGHVEVRLHVDDWSGQPATQFHGPRYQRNVVQPPFNYLVLLCSSVGERKIDWERGGFSWYAKLDPQHGIYQSAFATPCWFLSGVTMFLPLVSATVRLWSRRRPTK